MSPRTARLPHRLDSARLSLRLPTPDDAAALNAAILASHEEIRHWLPWAAEPQPLAETQAFCERAQSRFEAGEGLDFVMTLPDGEVIGGTGYPRLDWDVPKFEIGYWCATAHVGRGYVSEATVALTRHAFLGLDAARVELFIDDRNARSLRVAERLGFLQEGVLHAESRDPLGRLRNTRVYALTTLNALVDPAAAQPR